MEKQRAVLFDIAGVWNSKDDIQIVFKTFYLNNKKMSAMEENWAWEFTDVFQ